MFVSLLQAHSLGGRLFLSPCFLYIVKKHYHRRSFDLAMFGHTHSLFSLSVPDDATKKFRLFPALAMCFGVLSVSGLNLYAGPLTLDYSVSPGSDCIGSIIQDYNLSFQPG